MTKITDLHNYLSNCFEIIKENLNSETLSLHTFSYSYDLSDECGTTYTEDWFQTIFQNHAINFKISIEDEYIPNIENLYDLRINCKMQISYLEIDYRTRNLIKNFDEDYTKEILKNICEKIKQLLNEEVPILNEGNEVLYFYDLSLIFYKNCRFINVFKDRFKNKLLNSDKENILQIYTGKIL